MAVQTNGLVQHLRKIGLLTDDAGMPDGQLLKSFLARRDEAAFAALMRSHGPMVLGVCRRILRNAHDAEDAFQATFLVLVRKAKLIGRPELLGNWLHGVAYRTALAARGAAAKRRVKERDMAKSEAVEENGTQELAALLDRELVQLPEKYRAPIVLCDLEGKTRKEAARKLGWPEGTIHGRLARGRMLLARGLRRQGIAFSGGTMAALLSQNAASASVPTSVAVSTIKAASLLAAGQSLAGGLISPKVAALAEGVMKIMLISKLKAVVAVMLVLGFLLTGATIICGRMAAQGQEQQNAPTTLPGKKTDKLRTDQERIQGKWVYSALTIGGKNAWNDEVARTWKSLTFVGDKVLLVVNEHGKEVVYHAHFKLNPSRKPKEIDVTELDRDLKGKLTGCLYELDGDTLRLCHPREPGGDRPRAVDSREGSTDYLWTLRRRDREKIDPEKKKPAPVDPVPVRPDAVTNNEAFTAWGKETGGLQAGLGYDAGHRRAYHHGETVRLVLRIRNVSKKEVEFVCCRQYFMEVAPSMTDGRGKPVRLPSNAYTSKPRQEKVSLAPGKEIELYELNFRLQPATGADNETETADFAGRVITFHGTGKFQIQYKRLLEKPWAGPEPDPTLRKLATGKLELEVKDAKKLPQRKGEESFTAWGKEINGLQAGLGLRPGEHRVAYHHGDSVTLVVHVKNVGQKPVKFEYIRQFLDENPPTVTMADGKTVPRARIALLGEHGPTEVSLEPGKNIELELRLGGPKGAGGPGIRYTLGPELGTGKVTFQYERVLGNSSSGFINIDAALRKLATGKLKLEIKPAPFPANEFPLGWGGGGGKDYEIRVDRSVKHGGKASASIRSFVTTPTWYGALTQAFKANKYRGQRLRMTAYVKTKDVDNSAGLWIVIEGFDGKGNYSVSKDLMRTPIKGTNDWKQCEVVLDVPKEGAAQIRFGVMLAGKGQVWVDDFEFEAVGNDVKTTGSSAVEKGKTSVGPSKSLPAEPKNLDFEQLSSDAKSRPIRLRNRRTYCGPRFLQLALLQIMVSPLKSFHVRMQYCSSILWPPHSASQEKRSANRRVGGESSPRRRIGSTRGHLRAAGSYTTSCRLLLSLQDQQDPIRALG